jgi:mannose-6-phosphate isomerase
VEFNVAGRIIPESARFMGRDVEFALDMFSLELLPASAVQSRWRCQPRRMEKTATLHREALVDGRVTDRFNVLRTTVTRRSLWRAHGFTVFLVVDGSCEITTAHEQISLSQFDRIVVPHGLDTLRITANDRVVFLECLPPRMAPL